MTDNHSQDIGGLKEGAKHHDQSIKVLFKSNENRKREADDLEKAITAESTRREIEINKVLSALSEASANLGNMRDTLEAISEDSKETKQDVIDLTHQVGELEKQMSLYGEKQFNWGKFMEGLVTPKGMMMFAFAGLCVVAIFLAVFSPEALPDFFGIVERNLNK